MKNLPFFLFMLISWSYQLQAQNTTISGYVSDVQSGERLIGANLFLPQLQQGTVTNEQGFFSLTYTEMETAKLIVSYIGYQADTIDISTPTLSIELQPLLTLEAVEVKATAVQRAHQITQMSRIDMPIEDIKQIPVILGEVDVIKTLQLMPGVQAGNEGLAGLYVRGGSPDQNLVLLDGVPIYNPTHAIGIFSVFNADAIKNVSLIKGGFPARYGGRLSSVLNVNMKEGNLKEWHGEGTVSLVSSKLTIEGPIQKDKTSLLLAGRRTYADLLLNPIVKATDDDLKQLGTYFYDLNAKIQHIINDRHSLHLSGFAGRDVLRTVYEFNQDGEEGAELAWRNLIASLRWNYQISPQLFLNTTAYHTQYKIEIGEFTRSADFNNENSYISDIKDVAIRSILDWIPTPEHYVRFGGNLIDHTY